MDEANVNSAHKLNHNVQFYSFHLRNTHPIPSSLFHASPPAVSPSLFSFILRFNFPHFRWLVSAMAKAPHSIYFGHANPGFLIIFSIYFPIGYDFDW